jgi:hypothetical protein
MSNTEIYQMPVLLRVSALRAMEGIYGAALPPLGLLFAASPRRHGDARYRAGVLLAAAAYRCA